MSFAALRSSGLDLLVGSPRLRVELFRLRDRSLFESNLARMLTASKEQSPLSTWRRIGHTLSRLRERRNSRATISSSAPAPMTSYLGALCSLRRSALHLSASLAPTV